MPAKKRLIKAEDLYQFQLVSGVCISPDGESVVFVQHRVDQKTEKKFSNLWILSIEDGSLNQFTYGDQNDLMPSWSPDGKTIAFLSNRKDREKPAQIFLIPFNGGEARPLKDIDGEIETYEWSPSGRRLLCAIRKTDPEALERQKDEQKKKLGVVARHYDRLFYKLDGYGYLPRERLHLWTVDVRTGKARQLTDHRVFDENNPTWSPDGDWIAYVSNVCDEPDLYQDRLDLFIMPAKGGKARMIPSPVGPKLKPSFSPDGKWLAYYASEGEMLWYKNVGLWVVPVDGSAAPVNLTEKYDLNLAQDTINDTGTAEQMAPTWSKDGERLFFQVSLHGSTPLYSIRRNGEDLQNVIDGPGVVGSFTLDRSQKRLAYFFGKLDDPVQIYVLDLEAGNTRPMTRINRELMQLLDLGQIEEIWYKGAAGNDLQGWILKPPGFDPQKQYPSILEIHGGPLTQYGHFFMNEFYYLASQGYVVYFTNPRGGRGYGEAHAGAIHSSWGGADYDDLMVWVDLVAAKPYIDPARMGVTGGSYGGYMTVWIIGHTDRFKAAVTQRCVSNFISMWGSSDFNWTFQSVLNNQPPFKDLQKFWDHSPIKYIGNARTPTLVIHNEFDLRCPIEQGEQVYVALKTLGVDSEMVRFPDEFHGLSRNGRTDRRIARLNHILRWFDRYLK